MPKGAEGFVLDTLGWYYDVMDSDRVSAMAARIVARLNHHALRGSDGGRVLADLCDALLSEGIGIERAVVGYLVFHPQFDGITFTWDRQTREAKRERNTRPAILSGPSPFLEMQLRGVEELRYRLDATHALPFPFLDRLRSRGFTDYFAFFRPFGSVVDSALWPDLPLGAVMNEGVTGSFATTRPGGFIEHDLSFFAAIAVPLAVTVKVGAVLEMAETLLGLYLGPTSGRNVLRGHVRRGEGEIVDAVLWYSDLRGSTTLADTAPLHTYLGTLNIYYDCVVGAVVEHGGEILKFIGDGVLGMFPVQGNSKIETSARALQAAHDALHRLEHVNMQRSISGLPQIRCGTALHAGKLMYGNVGSIQRLDFTVMGATVNEVVRLETLCKILNVPLIVSEDVTLPGEASLTHLGRHALAGVAREIGVFTVSQAG